MPSRPTACTRSRRAGPVGFASREPSASGLRRDHPREQAVAGKLALGLDEAVAGHDLARSIGERIAAILASRPPGSGVPALIVQPRARRPLAALLRMRAPGCAVLSINELPAAQPIEVIAIVGGDDALPQPTGPAEALEHQREPLAA